MAGGRVTAQFTLHIRPTGAPVSASSLPAWIRRHYAGHQVPTIYYILQSRYRRIFEGIHPPGIALIAIPKWMLVLNPIQPSMLAITKTLQKAVRFVNLAKYARFMCAQSSNAGATYSPRSYDPATDPVFSNLPERGPRSMDRNITEGGYCYQGAWYLLYRV